MATEKQEETIINWQPENIGTCGNPCDILRILCLRVRAVPDLLIKFDGNRDGFVIGGSFYNSETDDFEFREVAFIHEDKLDEERLRSKQ